ncbi:DinB family protein [Ferroacidibacillus organovorans]|uniref:DinB family protein n=1 Tax=Ferroacidibacillus organovorans TaxID=1765683 RepID=UPI0007A7C85A|nr:DinB family protein [Ferroacidibacillus organovorans]KYP81741.1 damage-inducible protein DinB [Ferroacidibacillus organovorans]
MRVLFRYNWQVRDDWFSWCESVPEEELLKPRVGGWGTFLRTLFHIVDVEQAWILQGLQAKPEFHYRYEDYQSIHAIHDLSNECHSKICEFVENWSDDLGNKKLDDFTYGEVMRHVIAHEIHHIGQLSVWAREIGRQPVSANLISRGLYK